MKRTWLSLSATDVSSPAVSAIVESLEPRAMYSATNDLALLAAAVPQSSESAGDPAFRTDSGFADNTLAATDDGSTSYTELGFNVNFGGTTHAGGYVNNNGNFTFNSSLSAFTSTGISISNIPMLAPFLADVDTRGGGVQSVTYGQSTIDGHAAFGANWNSVGYFNRKTNKTNTFQLVIIDRSDVAAGDFDFEFNYSQIQWETGDFSGGNNGLGGTSARAGYAIGDNATAFEFAGSGSSGAFLDSNTGAAALKHNRGGSIVTGRYRFQVRGGTVQSNVALLEDSVSLARGATVFFGATAVGTPVSKTFTVRNDSVLPIVVQPVSVPAGFTVTSDFSANQSIAAGASATFTVRLDAAALGTSTGALTFATDEPTVGDFSVALTGVVSEPDVRVVINGTEITSALTDIELPSTVPGVNRAIPYSITNVGLAGTLTVTPFMHFGTHFQLGALDGLPMDLQPGATLSGTITFVSPSSESTGMDDFYFISNDADEATTRVTLTLRVVPPVSIVDNADAGFSSTGTWITANGVGRGGVKYIFGAPNSSDSAEWAFDTVPAGRYRIAATWRENANRTTDATYSLFGDGGTTLLATTSLNQRLAPNDFTADGNAWEELGVINLDGPSLLVRLSSPSSGVAIADAIRIECLSDAAATPQARLSVVGGENLISGSGQFDFGTLLRGVSARRTFSVRNDGAANLVVQPVLSSGIFTVVSNFAANTTIAPGQSANFTIQTLGNTMGNFSSAISMDSNDPSTPTFSFQTLAAISDTVSTIIDNRDSGYDNRNGWYLAPGVGRGGNLSYAFGGPSVGFAAWNFGDLDPGRYRVSATWKEHANRASNAGYAIRQGGITLRTAAIDQRSAPNDRTADGSTWEDLGIVTLTGRNLNVVLSGDANGVVVADAMRIERIAEVTADVPDNAAAWTPPNASASAAAAEANPASLAQPLEIVVAPTSAPLPSEAVDDTSGLKIVTSNADQLDALLADSESVDDFIGESVASV